ncbi:ATP-binding cassette domain-containing protein [Corynebacterium canis]|uniref:ATP-binding cassette domain-containing protein n=1 Tax=Corynebacterium canis TaxID=679663 RepID=A0A5C5TTG1_9CORY|nr:ATP-binding cassette domain-containing protein [Corynebacterium canis]
MYRGLLGHNGTGKRTLIDMILGLTNPTDGSVNTFGVSPKQALRRGIR